MLYKEKNMSRKVEKLDLLVMKKKKEMMKNKGEKRSNKRMLCDMVKQSLRN